MTQNHSWEFILAPNSYELGKGVGHEDSSVSDKVKGIVPVNDSVCHL